MEDLLLYLGILKVMKKEMKMLLFFQLIIKKCSNQIIIIVLFFVDQTMDLFLEEIVVLILQNYGMKEETIVDSIIIKYIEI